jgi:hypothetical protein
VSCGHTREASTAFTEACTAYLRIMSRIGANAFEHFRCTALRSAPEGRASRPGQRSYAILPFRNLLHQFGRFAEVTVLLIRLGGENEQESAQSDS